MKTKLIIGSMLLVLVIIISYNRFDKIDASDEKQIASLYAAIKKLEPLHQQPAKPGPNDWLASHKESGQSFKQYLKSNPIRPTATRNKLYVIPLGTFKERSSEIITESAAFMGLYFQVPVVLMKTEVLEKVPDYAKRGKPNSYQEQLLSTWVLHEFLKPKLPEDAIAMIAFTSTDLWPGDGWNFVFGQASLRERVGVWSIARNGDPNIDEKSFTLCLERTLKTATHETGHMFSIKHCIAWDCNMAGSNSLEESDRHPLYLCPECVAKVSWATRSDLSKRYGELLTFTQKHKLTHATDYYTRAINALKNKE